MNDDRNGDGNGGGNGDARERTAPLDPAGEALDEAAEKALRDLLARNPDATLEELNEVLREHIAASDRVPRDAGALSSDQVQRLLAADWEEASGSIRLHPALPLADLAESRALHNARALLRFFAEEGELRATGRGNLQRVAVGALIERMRWPDGYLDELQRVSRVLNEEDVFPLHTLRVVLGLGGLIKLRKSAFSITRRGARLLEDGGAGELFRLLFVTTFRRFNLGYLDRLPPVADFQRTAAYPLFRLGLVADGWATAEALVERVTLPFIRSQLPRQPHYDPLVFMLETRLLRPLEGFGLLELRESPGPHPLLPERAYRKTRLYDRFLRFHLPPSLPVADGAIH